MQNKVNESDHPRSAIKCTLTSGLPGKISKQQGYLAKKLIPWGSGEKTGKKNATDLKKPRQSEYTKK